MILELAGELEKRAKEELDAARTRHNERNRRRDGSEDEDEDEDKDDEGRAIKMPVLARGLSPPPDRVYLRRFDGE